MRIVVTAVVLLCLTGCTAMMMSGGGGYEAPKDECTESARAAGKCDK